ncbi:MAG: hypothetical protein OXL36_08780 [Bryobacterales bacterium]|nr:hypothetical protein [Bryobacterales bacterium]MDE0294704.1 hypothetical protein [Bryobacterales bacterium]
MSRAHRLTARPSAVYVNLAGSGLDIRAIERCGGLVFTLEAALMSGSPSGLVVRDFSAASRLRSMSPAREDETRPALTGFFKDLAAG